MSIAWSLFYLMWRWNFKMQYNYTPLYDGCILEPWRFTLTEKSTLNIMFVWLEWYLSFYLSISIYISIYLFAYLSTYLSIYLPTYIFLFSIYLFIHLSVCWSIYLSFYLSICLYVNLPIYLLTYPSGFVYPYNGTVEWYDCDSFEMTFDHDWS